MRRLLLLLALLCAFLAMFRHRRQILEWLAPPEADYTPDATVEPAYPRPGADLTPLWTFPLEEGYGGATIDGGEVFVLDREPGVGDTMRVISLETGEELWTFHYAAPGRHDFAGSRTYPVVVGEHVYICGSHGQLHCIDRTTREPVWRRDLEEDLGATQPEFGFAASPLVFDDKVILPSLGPGAGLIAVDRHSGKPLYRTQPVGKSHSTPVVLTVAGKTAVLFLSCAVQGMGSEDPAPTTLHAFDPTTGATLWEHTLMLTSVPIPPPVLFNEEHLFLTGGYGGGSSLLRVYREDGAFAFEEVFHVRKGSQLHPGVVHDEHIYLVANENSNESRRKRDRGGLTCFDKQGNELWSTGAEPYLGRGHMLRLGNHLLIQDGQSGMLRLILATPSAYTPVATANVFQVEPKARNRMWAPMTRVGGTFVVRGRSELRCVRLDDRRAESSD